MTKQFDLCTELREWCAAQALPYLSADELIAEDVTDAQAAYLRDFIARWESAVAEEHR